MSRVCTECNKHGTCAKEHKVASGKGWCSKFYQSRRALEADRDALRAELDGVRQANRVLDSAAKDAQSWAYQLQECRAELDLVRGAIRADDERLYAAWVRIHGAPDDCANIGCDAPEWMADEILRLRAELDRTKGEMERVRRNHLRRMEHDAIDLTCGSFRFTERDHARLNRIIEGCRTALERKADA